MFHTCPHSQAATLPFRTLQKRTGSAILPQRKCRQLRWSSLAASASNDKSTSTSQPETSSSSQLDKLPPQRPSQPQGPQKDEDNLFAGVLEEVNLIEWPKFSQALRDTFVVIGIVGGLSVLLFITNSTFTELSKVVYKS